MIVSNIQVKIQCNFTLNDGQMYLVTGIVADETPDRYLIQLDSPINKGTKEEITFAWVQKTNCRILSVG